MAEAAKVIRIVGSGEQQLRDAIQSGIVSVDAERAYRQVLEDNKRLRRENRVLREQLAVVQESRKNERRDRAEAYRMVLAKDAEYQRVKDWRVSACVGFMAIGGLILAVSTIVAMM